MRGRAGKYLGPAALAVLLSCTQPLPAAGEDLVSPEVAAGLATDPVQEEELQKLEDVLRHAWFFNPSLMAARAELLAVRERLPQALSGWQPDVEANASIVAEESDGNSFGGGGGPEVDGVTSKGVAVDLTQPLWRGGRTVAESGSARATIGANEALLAAQGQDVLFRAAQTYANVYRDTALLALAESNREVIARQLEASIARFDAGDLTRTDVSQAEARLARADADRTNAAGNLRRSRAVFEQIVAMPAGETGEPRLNLPIPTDLKKALELAEGNNPEISAAAFVHDAAEHDARAVGGEMLPEFSLTANWNRQYDPQPGFVDESSSRNVGIRARLPLYAGGATVSRLRQARHTASRRQIDILDTRSRIREEAISAWESLVTARAEIESRKAQAEATRLASEGVEEEAGAGIRTVLDVLDAKQEYMDAQAALITAQCDEVVATFGLAKALGLLTPSVLGIEKFEAR